jgi:hypothetical protein
LSGEDAPGSKAPAPAVAPAPAPEAAPAKPKGEAPAGAAAGQPPEDYQLLRALDLLRGLAFLSPTRQGN